jgi:Flp pilus assembly pilin Flp
MKIHVKRFKRGEQAQGMTEYIIIVALIALVAIAGVRIFGDKLMKLFEKKANEINTQAGGDNH